MFFCRKIYLFQWKSDITMHLSVIYLEIDFEKQLSLVFWIKSINFVTANKKTSYRVCCDKKNYLGVC